MQAGASGSSRVAIGLMVAVAMPLGCGVAAARPHHRHHHVAGHHWVASRHWHRRYAARPVLQCVAFVKEETGVILTGNAANWWDEADGLYAKGPAPEMGAILSFRGTGRIRLGHVAVVSRVVSAREIEVDHSHWASNGIARGVSVIDVSPANDWTAVRVKLNGGDRYGSVYATNGFIYDRAPDARVQLASTPARPIAAPASLAPTKTADPASDRFVIATAGLSLADGADELAAERRPGRDWRVQHHRRWQRQVARRKPEGEVAEQPRRRLKLSLSYLPLFTGSY
jgi:hypothetical protein